MRIFPFGILATNFGEIRFDAPMVMRLFRLHFWFALWNFTAINVSSINVNVIRSQLSCSRVLWSVIVRLMHHPDNCRVRMWMQSHAIWIMYSVITSSCDWIRQQPREILDTWWTSTDVAMIGWGTRPTPPSHASVEHTFEAVVGSWGSVSAPAVSRVMGGTQERNKNSNFF